VVGRRRTALLVTALALLLSACASAQMPPLPGMGDQPPAAPPSVAPTVEPTPPAGTAVSDCPATGKAEEEGLTPAALNVMRCAIHNFGDTEISGAINRSGGGDHPKGQAVDYMVYGDRALGQQVADWAVGNAGALDVKYVIWYQQIWLPGSGRWVDCNGGNCYAGGDDTLAHRDHVHISVNG
jgi:hypothetical protein